MGTEKRNIENTTKQSKDTPIRNIMKQQEAIKELEQLLMDYRIEQITQWLLDEKVKITNETRQRRNKWAKIAFENDENTGKEKIYNMKKIHYKVGEYKKK